jgi:membrane protein DedA with SNARE-associated domain
VAERDRERQRWHRFILAWILGTALWLAAMLITQAAIRPAPSFAVMASLVVSVPAIALAIGFLVLWRRTRP